MNCGRCGSGVAADEAVCLTCGFALSESTQQTVVDQRPKTSETGEPELAVLPSSACQHCDSPPGSVICVTCGDPIELMEQASPAHGVILTLPWGEHTMERGDVLDIGREVGPFERILEPYHTVGRRHATFRLTERGNLLLRDNASTNGTFVNGVRCLPTGEIEVPDGAEIRFSSALLVRVRRKP